jgi:hypothetical protein
MCLDGGELLNKKTPFQVSFFVAGSGHVPRWRRITQQKNTFSGVLFCSGEWIRTTDLQVMSLTSCHCSTPHRVGYLFLNRM